MHPDTLQPPTSHQPVERWVPVGSFACSSPRPGNRVQILQRGSGQTIRNWPYLVLEGKQLDDYFMLCKQAFCAGCRRRPLPMQRYQEANPVLQPKLLNQWCKDLECPKHLSYFRTVWTLRSRKCFRWKGWLPEWLNEWLMHPCPKGRNISSETWPKFCIRESK